jgi:hypothetical protein
MEVAGGLFLSHKRFLTPVICLCWQAAGGSNQFLFGDDVPVPVRSIDEKVAINQVQRVSWHVDLGIALTEYRVDCGAE